MTVLFIIGAMTLGSITGIMTAKRGDLFSLAISLAALLMLVLFGARSPLHMKQTADEYSQKSRSVS